MLGLNSKVVGIRTSYLRIEVVNVTSHSPKQCNQYDRLDTLLNFNKGVILNPEMKVSFVLYLNQVVLCFQRHISSSTDEFVRVHCS
jgi:hypothetical protein